MVSTSSTPGISGWPGKCPSNTGEVSGTRASAVITPSPRATTRSIIWKYSRRTARTAPSGRGLLRRDEFLDPLRQVPHDEILFGRRLARIDLLRPGLDRDLDAEGLVDGEDDV